MKIPPHDESTEFATIGAMIMHPLAAETALELLRADDFYLPKHRTAFIVIQKLLKNGQAVDEIILVSELEAKGWTRDDARYFVGNAQMSCPSAASIETYAAKLHDLTRQRILQEMCWALNDGIERKEDSQSLLDYVCREVDRIADRSSRDCEPEDMHALAEPLVREALTLPPIKYAGLATGIGQGCFDALIDGLQSGNHILIAARTSMGKSTLLGALMRGVLKNNPGKGAPLLASTEMTSLANSLRAFGGAAGVHSRALVKRDLTPDQREFVQHTLDSKAIAGLFTVSVGGKTVNQLYAIAKRHKRRNGLPLLIVDLAQHLKSHEKSEREQLAAISRDLRQVALDLNTCLISAVQLNRSLFLKEDTRPELHHLQGTGAWEQDADQVILLHRPGYYGKSDNRTEVIFAKDRNGGRLGSTFLAYNASTGEFWDANEKNVEKKEVVDAGLRPWNS
jgi:replicative DNA helicase